MNKTTKVVIGSLAVAALSSVSTASFLNATYNLKSQIILQEKTNLEEKYKLEIDSLKKQIEKKQVVIEQLEDDLVGKQKTLDSIIKEQITLTFYTTLPEENGGFTVTCEGKELKDGIVASNYYPLGTKIIIDGKTYTVSDRGGSSFDKPNRLDVLIERKEGETDEQYKARVNALGKVTKTAYIIK